MEINSVSFVVTSPEVERFGMSPLGVFCDEWITLWTIAVVVDNKWWFII